MDVFFVISGFVIGGLLVRELQKTGRVSGKAFYLRRARRLLPAVGFMTVVVVAMSAVLITPLGAAQESAGHAASAASVFLSNAYFFLFTGGYFQPGNDTNPFLHTWSLSVEEQFYFVLPWLLVLGWTFARRSKLRTLGVVVGLGWTLSFVACILFSFAAIPAWLPIIGPRFAEYPEMTTQFAFFSPVTRSWEFLTGVIVLLVGMRWTPQRPAAKAMGITGLALVIAGYLLLKEGGNFPGLMALVPVVGAALLLLGGATTRPQGANRVLATRPLVAIGDISYGWYLWHWPVILFATLWLSSAWVPLIAALAALVPTVLSYRYLEKPIHSRRWLATNRSMTLAALLCIMLPLLSGVALVQAWRHSWWRPDIAQMQSATTTPHADTVRGCADITAIGPGSGSCVFETPGATETVLLIGDSNAGMYAEPMVEAATAAGVNLEIATRNACPIVAGTDYGDAACRDFLRNSLNFIDKRQPPYAAVVVVNSGKYPLARTRAFEQMAAPGSSDDRTRGITGYANAVAAAVKQIGSTSPVLLIEPIPQGSGGVFPRCLLPSVLSSVSKDCASFSADFVRANRTDPVAAVSIAMGDSATTYDPSVHLCQPDGTCSMYKDGELVYRDESHLSVAGAEAFAADLRRALSTTLGRGSGGR